MKVTSWAKVTCWSHHSAHSDYLQSVFRAKCLALVTQVIVGEVEKITTNRGRRTVFGPVTRTTIHDREQPG